MRTTRRAYSGEFKSEAVELAARIGRSMAEVECDLGLPEGLLKAIGAEPSLHQSEVKIIYELYLLLWGF